MKCDICKIEYPSDILSPLYSSKEVNTRMLCGICALAEINKVHGINRTQFSPGSRAEGCRKAALRIRDKKPKSSK